MPSGLVVRHLLLNEGGSWVLTTPKYYSLWIFGCHASIYGKTKIVYYILMQFSHLLKPSDTFGTEFLFKVHRFTNNLRGLQKVMVKDFSRNTVPWNALLLEKTLKQYQFSASRITDLFQTHVMTRRNMRKQGWVFPLFSPDSDDRLSLNLHRFVILCRSCDTWSVGLGHYCLPKVSSGFRM